MYKTSRFYGTSCRESMPTAHVEESYTQVLDAIIDENGDTVIKPVVIETLQDPYAKLKFSDFAIDKLLRAGVSIKPIDIKSDNRFDNDAARKQVAAFNERLATVSDKLFNPVTEE